MAANGIAIIVLSKKHTIISQNLIGDFVASITVAVSEKKIICTIDTIVTNTLACSQITLIFKKYEDLSISVTYSSLFMKIFLAFHKEYPQEHIQDTFKETGLNQTFQDIEEQKYRISIFYCFQNRRIYHQAVVEQYNLDMISLHSNVPVEILISSSNQLSKRMSFDADEIKRYPIITYEDFQYEDWLGIFSINPNQNITKIFDRGGLRDVTGHSDAIAVIKKGSIDTNSNNNCMTLPIVGDAPLLDIYMLKQKQYQLSSRERDFLEFFKRGLSDYYGIMDKIH